MIEHQIGHQVVMTGELADMRPVAKLTVHFPVVDHREAVVATPREEGQHVYTTNAITQACLKKFAKHSQWRHPLFYNGVTIANHPLIFFAP